MEVKSLILVVGLIYLGISAEQLWKGSIPNAIVYFGYGISNYGLWKLAV